MSGRKNNNIDTMYEMSELELANQKQPLSLDYNTGKQSKGLPSGLPRISIITPSLNQGEYLEDTIRSVLLQGYPNLEYIVIDGGSTDGSVDIIKKYSPWLQYWESKKDNGQTHAINKGLKRATGKVAAYLNSDDIYLPGTLLHVGKVFADKQTDILVGRRFVKEINRNYLSPRFLKMYLTPYVDPFIFGGGYSLPQECVFWNQERVKGFLLDESYHFCMDVWWFVHIYSNARITHTSRRLGYFRTHAASKTCKLQALAREEILRMIKIMQRYSIKVPAEDVVKIRRHYKYASCLAFLRNSLAGKNSNFSYYHPRHLNNDIGELFDSCINDDAHKFS